MPPASIRGSLPRVQDPTPRAPRFGRLGVDGPPPPEGGGESFATLLSGAGGARVERIASRGHADPPGRWYDQDGDEFVLLVAGAARLAFADGSERALAPGDWVAIPARCRHRVAWTDPGAETLWLAVHMPPPARPPDAPGPDRDGPGVP